MKLVFSFFRRFLLWKWPLLLGFLSIPLGQGADVAITVLIGRAINRIDRENSLSFLVGTMGWMALFVVLHGLFRYWQRWLIVVVSRRFENGLKQELFDKLTSLPFGFHSRSRSGDVVSRLTSDVENLRMFLGPGLMYTAGAVVVVPISLVLLFQLNATLSLAMVLPMVGMGLAMQVFSPTLHRHSLAVQESLADISHRAQENFAGIRIVKGYGREETQARRFEETSASNKDNQNRLAHARGLTHASVNGANDLTFVVILIIGGLAAIDAKLPIGDLFQFIDLTFKVFWPLISLGWIAGMYPRAVVSAQRVTELLSETSDITDSPSPVRLPEVRGKLELRGVHFRYPDAKTDALTGIDLVVPAGSTLGVVGPTGSGKTTLLYLVGRLFEAKGEILLDDVPLRELPLATVRGAIGYVPQDSFLFSEPYIDNLAFGAEEPLGEPEAAALVQRVRMSEEVAAFPDGIHQLIGERGVTLSGGQRQRTCIARALARHPRILILDNALSAVDTETEKELVAHLRDVGRGRTVLIAAHRLASVRHADQILVLDERGRIEALGTHAELVRRPGWYRTTWRVQQREEELSEL
jgi:ATP-binding cassette subfamily B protein